MSHSRCDRPSHTGQALCRNAFEAQLGSSTLGLSDRCLHSPRSKMGSEQHPLVSHGRPHFEAIT